MPCVVGLGSWAFHMTLLYEMQLFDELPMVWGSCILVYCLSEVQKPSVKEKKISNLPLFIFLTLFAISFTAIYLLWPQPIFQHASYGLLVFTIVVLDVRLIRNKECRICKQIFLSAVLIYIAGFILWNLDKVFCNNLRSLRSRSSGVLDPLTQLHGWWHLLTGYASYKQILLVIHASFDYKNDKKLQKLDLRPCQYGFGLRWFKKSRDF